VNDNIDLANQLEQAGHGDMAEALRNRQLAEELRGRGRDDLADQLEGTAAPEPEPSGPVAGRIDTFGGDPEREAQAVLLAMKRDLDLGGDAA
jgi:hypothetical protein